MSRHKDQGCDCTTLQLGTGLEADAEMDLFAQAVIEAAARYDYPIYIETHRATITQDIKRTLDLIERFPDLRFNGDFANWYIGHELHYGDLDAKIQALQPVISRTRFMHLRVSSSAFAQLSPDQPEAAAPLEFYRTVWTAVFRKFLKDETAGDRFPVHPELLPPWTAYPRMIQAADGGWIEASDRWADSLKLIEIASECFRAACADAFPRQLQSEGA